MIKRVIDWIIELKDKIVDYLNSLGSYKPGFSPLSKIRLKNGTFGKLELK